MENNSDDNTFQKKKFLNSEGDQYFQRNLPKYTNNNDYFPLEMEVILKYLKSNMKILDIGCSNGKNLNFIHTKINCECFGIDPSSNAIEYGKKNYPNINLSIGTADSLKFPDNFFDFIWFGFSLYLVDRALLSRVVAEVDRVLKDKGFILIADFDNKIPKKRIYKHAKGVYSYKMEYSKLFLAYPHFVLADKFCFSYNLSAFVENPLERFSANLIFKDHDSAYSPEEDK